MECCICKKDSKYKCPECGFRTCSADCVKSHKIVYGCSGVSKPLKFIPLKEFSDGKMRKDMNYLMNIVRVSDQSYKLVTKLSRADNRKRFNFLANECRSRRISLKLMPKAMARHIHNTSLYDKFEKTLIWRIEWKLLTGSDAILCEISENSENLSLGQLLQTALTDFRKIPAFVLSYSAEESISSRVFWLISKTKEQAGVQELYKELDTSKTLREILPELSELTPIVEYPTLYISTAKNTACLQLINN